MRKRHMWKNVVSWTLAASLIFSSSFMAMAEEAPAAEATEAVEEAPAVEAMEAAEEAPAVEVTEAAEEAPAEEATEAAEEAPAVEVTEAAEEAPAVEVTEAAEEAPAAEATEAAEEAPAVEATEAAEEAPAEEVTEAASEEATEEQISDTEPAAAEIVSEEDAEAPATAEAAALVEDTACIFFTNDDEDDIPCALGEELCVTDLVKYITASDENGEDVEIPVSEFAANNLRVRFISQDEDSEWGYSREDWEKVDEAGQKVCRVGLNVDAPRIFLEQNVGGSWQRLASAGFSVEECSADYYIECTSKDPDSVLRLYAGDSATFELKNRESAFPGEEKTTIQWLVNGKSTPTDDIPVTWTANGRKVTVTVKDKVKEYKEIIVSAQVLYKGHVIYSLEDESVYGDVYEDEVWYEFGIGEDDKYLIDVYRMIDKNISYYIRNKDNPDGAEKQTQIQKLEVVSQLDADGKATSGLVELNERPFDQGWEFHAMKFGSAVLRATYTAYDGTTATKDFKAQIVGSVYFVSVKLPATGNNILYGQTRTFSTELRYTHMDPVEYGYAYKEEYPTNYSVTAEIENSGESSSGWSCKVVDGTKVQVTAPAESDENDNAGVDIKITANVNGQAVDFCMIYPHASSSVYSIEPQISEEMLDVAIGGELDLPAMGVKGYVETKNGKSEAKDIKYELRYSPDDWSVKPGTENNLIPTLIRNTPTGTSVSLYMYANPDDYWDEVAAADYVFKNFYYNLDFTYSYGSKDKGVTFTDPLTLTLQDSKLAGLDYSIDWGLYYTLPGHNNPVEATDVVYSTTNKSITIKSVGNTQATWLSVQADIYYKKSFNVGSAFAIVNLQKKPTMTLTATSLKMKKGQSTTALKVTNMQSWDSLASVTSSNKSVVEVSNVKKAGTFKLKAKKKGTATLTITLASGLYKTVKVTVQTSTVKTTKISGLSKSYSLEKGKKLTLKPTIAPITSQEKVTYSTSNKKVATVSSKGVVTAKAVGTAKITVKSGSKKVTCTIKVKSAKCTKLKGVKSKLTLKVKKTATLKPKRVPASSTSKITYTSSNKKVATVSSKGKITAKKKGTAIITVKCDKVKVTCKVTVK